MTIRFRPGRSWRQDPAIAEGLRTPGTSKSGAHLLHEVLDVLGIEVDGVDVAAGVGEAPLLDSVGELAFAVLELGRGAPAVQATVGRGPVELVLESRGADLALSLVALAPEARLLVRGIVVDGARLRHAAAQAARTVHDDVVSLAARLGSAPRVRALRTLVRELERAPAIEEPPSFPTRPAAATVLRVPRGERRLPTLELRLSEDAGRRLRSAPDAPQAPLAAHLGDGALVLKLPGLVGLEAPGPLLLTLRGLLRGAGLLLRAAEAGEPSGTLAFGPHELRCDLARAEVLVPGLRGCAAVSATSLVRLCADAAVAYAEVAQRRGARDSLAEDLRERGRSLLQHLRDLSSGDLHRSPAPAPPAPAAPSPAGPLSRGQVRRLVYRQAFSVAAPQAVRAFFVPDGPLLVESADSVCGLDLQTGHELFRVAALPGAVLCGSELYYAEPGAAVCRLDAQTGEPRFRRKLRAGANLSALWPVPGGVLCALPGDGLARVDEAGALRFRVRLSGGEVRAVVQAGAALAISLPSQVCGLDPADGRILWKRRARDARLAVAGELLIVLAAGTLCALDPVTGEPVWTSPCPAGPLAAGTRTLWVLAGGELHGFDPDDGRSRFVARLPFALLLETAPGPASDLALATGLGGAAAAVDDAGAVRWSREPDGAAPAAPALASRGVALLHRQGALALHDLASGLPLASLPGARAAALAANLSCAALDGATLALHRLVTHLGVVR